MLECDKTNTDRESSAVYTNVALDENRARAKPVNTDQTNRIRCVNICIPLHIETLGKISIVRSEMINPDT